MTAEVESSKKEGEVMEQQLQKKNEVVLPKETLEAFGGDELRARVFYEKYALRDESGKQIETIPKQLWQRVARELASVEIGEEKKREWTDKFYWLLDEFKFVPGGRIMFGAGQPRRSTLLNCYFFKIREDSIEGIFDWCKEAARTYSFGGGVGTDISLLRPRGTPVNNSAIVSSGSVSFMELLSTTTGTIGQAGRRGALMITIRVDHPDIFDFINVKKDLRKVNYANISVKVTDEFMQAVEKDADFTLRFKNEKVSMERTVRAREVWNALVKAAWQSDEPGLIFWDTIKRDSTTEYNGMAVEGVNPCSEQTLENYGCCCLGSINLSAFVKDAFTDRASIDWAGLTKAAQCATRFLDNVLDYNADKHPLPQQKKASLWSRRVGVGTTGLGDMLIKMGKKYDDEATVEFVDKLFERLTNAIYDYSTDLAKEKGPAPAFEAKKHLAQPFIQRLDTKVKDKIKRQGIRNSALTTVPPVGSGSIFVGSSSGVEPVFALYYTRRSKSLSEGEFKVWHPLVREYMKVFRVADESNLPPYFVTAHQIKPEMRVKMQAAIQKHIDTAISSTVNLPQDISTEEVEKIYFLAWKLGCKGITVYREGSREGILETKNLEKKEAAEVKQEAKPAPAASFERPKVMTGRTLKLKLPQGGLYVTANTDENGGLKEVFVTLGKLGGDEKADAEAIGRLISLYLQHGGDIQSVIKMLKGIRGKYVSWEEGVQLLSIPDAVAKALEVLTAGKVKKESATPLMQGGTCPDCGENSIIYESGCFKCTSCGYSKCE
ncbi:MAG TPA: adenosylcobalamin-dependent ribonucleoside-diphosphate reductase [Nitrososphaerales archaeon]|nr:adenosylcobalamin-dependent ribonucleoside-diphosphate reductase [Nitrososphaerales archaeon]